MFNLFDSGGYPLGRRSRWLLAAWALLLAGGFALAFQLDPDPRGFGTHQRLGLPPCTFRVLCGFPCPSCGMTTSFAHFIRGNFAAACAANPAGLILALVCAGQIPWCGWSVIRGRLWGVSHPEPVLVWALSSLYALCVLNWMMTLLWG
jgi:hypothetical protein